MSLAVMWVGVVLAGALGRLLCATDDDLDGQG